MNTPEWRVKRVEELFNQIALIASLRKYKHTDEVYPHIKHLIPELWRITKYQIDNHELDHKWGKVE